MSIGSALARAREEAGLSIEQISAATRIRRTIVAAIEDDDFSKSGGDFYARAHIRGIAQAIGTDATPLLAEFDRDSGSGPPDVSAVFETETRAKPERRGPNWSAAMAAALALVLVVAIVRALTGGSGDQDVATGEVTRSAVPAPALVSPRAPGPAASVRPSPPAPSPRPSEIAKAPRNEVTVALAAPRGKTWVRVTGADGNQLFEGLLSKGSQRSFTDPRKLQLVIGNPVAVDLRVNGQAIGSPGDDGKVARVSFTPQDPAVG